MFRLTFALLLAAMASAIAAETVSFDPDRFTPEGRMLMAARAGRLDDLKRAIASGIDPYYNTAGEDILEAAAQYGRTEVVKWLLGEFHFDVTHPVGSGRVIGPAGSRALLNAAQNGHAEIVQLLLDAGVPASRRDEPPICPVMIAARDGNRAMLSSLIKAGAVIKDGYYDHSDADGIHSVPTFVIAHKDLENLKLLLEIAHVDPNHVDGFHSLIVQATRVNWHEGVDYLLRQGADPYRDEPREGKNAFDEASDARMKELLLRGALGHAGFDSEERRGAIDLMVGATLNDSAIFARGLAARRAISFKDPRGNTPLRIAIAAGREDMALELARAGTPLNGVNRYGTTALMSACARDMKLLVPELLARGADVELATGKGYTPLQSAALRGHEDIVRLLLEKGASVDSTRSERDTRETPLMVAAKAGHKAIVKLLLAAKANPNALQQDGEPPLFYAAVSDDPEIIQLLLDAGADKDYVKPNAEGTNAASIAMYTNRVKTLRFLTDLGLRDELAAANVISGNGGGPEVRDFLKANYGPVVEETLFWKNVRTVAEIETHLKQGGNVNFMGKATPLQQMIFAGRFDLATYLVQHGAYLTLVGLAWPDTPLDLCIGSRKGDPKRMEFVALMFREGLNPDGYNKESNILIGTPPLIQAIECGDPEMMDFLLDRGANPEATTTMGVSVLDALDRSDHFFQGAAKAAWIEKIRQRITAYRAAHPPPPSETDTAKRPSRPLSL